MVSQQKESLCNSADSLGEIVRYGVEAGIISSDDVARLAAEAYSLTAALAARRTGGKSTSLPRETVRGLYDSLSYTAGIYLCRLEKERAARVLAQGGIDSARRRGRRIIERCLQRACFYVGAAQRHRIFTDNETYVLTLMGALRGFFRIYDPVFAAHDRRIGCDYPTAVHTEGTGGAEYVAAYAQKMCFESCFCAAADGFFVRSACEFYAPDSRHAVFSIMEAVIEGLILTAYGIALPAPHQKVSRAGVLRELDAKIYAAGREKYMNRACDPVMRAADVIADSVPCFPGDEGKFEEYCFEAAKKTAESLAARANAAAECSDTDSTAQGKG